MPGIQNIRASYEVPDSQHMPVSDKKRHTLPTNDGKITSRYQTTAKK